MCRPQYPELFAVPVGYASTLIAPVSHFDYHMLALLPMSVLAYLALVKTDSLLTTLARVTLIVYLLASVCTLALPLLQYIGLLCWTTLGLWAVLLFVAALRDTHPAALTTANPDLLAEAFSVSRDDSQRRRHFSNFDVFRSQKSLLFNLLTFQRCNFYERHS